MEALGKGLEALALVAALVLLTPFGWVGMLILAAALRGF